MAAMSGVPESLLPYRAQSIHALSNSTRLHLAQHLNLPKDLLSPNTSRIQDYRGLAEVLNFSSIEIDNIARDASPTMQLFNQWIIRPDVNIGHLLEGLCEIERFDILCNPQFEILLKRDVQKHEQHMAQNQALLPEPIQVQDVGTSGDVERKEFINITINEKDGQPEYFDAFVSYTSPDFWFVKQMIYKLEVLHGLKLCLPQRDLQPGCAQYVIMAKLIEDRCKKMIIILSPNFHNSPECEFQSRFGFALSPGAKEKKLIPVIIEPCIVPSIFHHIALLDYTKCDVIDWFWERLAKSLKKDSTASAILGHRKHIAEAGSSTSGSERAPFRYVYNQTSTSGISSSPSSVSNLTRAEVHPFAGYQDNLAYTSSSQTSSAEPETSLNYLSTQSSISNAHFGMDTSVESWMMSSCEIDQELQQHQPMEMLSMSSSPSVEPKSNEISMIPENIVTQDPRIRPPARQESSPTSFRSKLNSLFNQKKLEK